MAVYYVASKLSIVACRAGCFSNRRRHEKICREFSNESENDLHQSAHLDEMIEMGYSAKFPINDDYAAGASTDDNFESKFMTPHISFAIPSDDDNNSDAADVVRDSRGVILNAPLESLIESLLRRQHNNVVGDYDQNFIFSFLLSSRIFIQPHELLRRLIEFVPKNDESLVRLVLLMKSWTKNFPYDFRDEEMMSLIKHIVARCENVLQLRDVMSESLSALLIKLTELSRHEEEMKTFRKPLNDHYKIDWPNSSKLAKLLGHIERKFAKHIGPEEFVQCSSNLIKQQSNYDVPASSSSSSSNSRDTIKKKTCNLESYFEWSNRLRLVVANEILQCPDEHERTNKIELWSSVAQHCLLVGNYNSATSVLQPICRLQSMMDQRFISLSNQQQLDCLFKHIEQSQDLNLWKKQTQQQATTSNSTIKREKRIQFITPNSSPPPHTLITHEQSTFPEPSISCSSSSQLTTTRTTQEKSKSEWVVLPVFIDIVKLALKTRDDCSTRLPNGSINLCAFTEMAAIVSAFTNHMTSVSITSSTAGDIHELDYIVNHILTCPLRDENELFAALEKEKSSGKINSYYDVP